MSVLGGKHVNLEAPRWDQRTFIGRAQHFFVTTNPLNLLRTDEELDQAKSIVQKYRNGEALNICEDELWHYKHVYDSAFHPETGEKMFILGRMSAQVPSNMFITGCMMTFYRTTRATIFWQWVNQSFNALVNYTNRSGTAEINMAELGSSYALATSSSVVAALSLNSLTKSMPPLIGRLVPFAAVGAANCVNIPFMRQKEIREGIAVTDEAGKQVGTSSNAAVKGIREVVISRILMAVPSMVFTPIIMNSLERRKSVLARYAPLAAVTQVLLCGFFLTFATPLCCAIFPQQGSISVESLEEPLRAKLKAENVPYVYYNKGL